MSGSWRRHLVVVCLFWGLGACGGRVWGAPTSRLSETFADVKAKLAGGQQANIVVVGDSLSFRDGSYLPVWRDLLQQTYGDVGDGYQGFSFQTGGGFNSGWQRGEINQDTPPHRGLDGLWAASSTGPFPPTHSSANFAPWSSKAELHYVMAPGGGSFGVQLPDGSEQTISTDSVTEDVGTWPYELSAGEQLRIQPQGDGEITILGQNNVGDGGGVRLHRLANGGWGVNNYLQRDWTFDSQLPLIDPDLFVIFLGQNDQGESAAGYKQKMQLLGQRLLSSAPDAELLFIGLNWSAGSNQLPLLVGAINEVADEGGHGFIGLQEAAGSHEFFEAQGYYDDGIHYSQAGGDYLGNLLFDAFANESLTAIPEPATLVIMAGGFACALRSRRGRGRRRANRELV